MISVMVGSARKRSSGPRPSASSESSPMRRSRSASCGIFPARSSVWTMRRSAFSTFGRIDGSSSFVASIVARSRCSRSILWISRRVSRSFSRALFAASRSAAAATTSFCCCATDGCCLPVVGWARPFPRACAIGAPVVTWGMAPLDPAAIGIMPVLGMFGMPFTVDCCCTIGGGPYAPVMAFGVWTGCCCASSARR